MPLPGPYKIKNLHVTLDAVYTNTVSTSPVRGAGRPNAAYAMDRVIDAVARHLSIDPAEMRQINLVKNEDFPYQPGSKHRNGSMMTYDSGDYTGMLAMVKEMADYDGFAARKKESEKTVNIEEDLANLKSEMNEIKSLLKELVSNVHQEFYIRSRIRSSKCCRFGGLWWC